MFDLGNFGTKPLQSQIYANRIMKSEINEHICSDKDYKLSTGSGTEEIEKSLAVFQRHHKEKENVMKP